MKYKFWANAVDGTKVVYTYTEILTPKSIREYINDELIDARDNPLGVIPIVHIRNINVPGSPWGLADINSIVSLNRAYNEQATNIADILDYHSAPTTIVSGAKTDGLVKGAREVWSIPKDANVFNLENSVDLAGPLQFLEMLKRAMHEMTGVPETALGQVQPISNTSGVALSIQYLPMMMRDGMKKAQYSAGIKEINELALRTLWIFEPDKLLYDPSTEGEIEEGLPVQIDPDDPLAYQTEVEWPPPLPTDVLVKLNEIQVKMALGLESKEGALADLGEAFPKDKLNEIFSELVQDAEDQGALDLTKASINAAILQMTGMVAPGAEPFNAGSNSTGDSSSSSDTTGGNVPQQSQPVMPQPSPLFTDETKRMMEQIVTRAYGTKIPQRRNPDSDAE